MGPRRALLVPAGWPGDPQATLVRPRGGGGVGTGDAYARLACPTARVGRPLREPGHGVARGRGAGARPPGGGPLGRGARGPPARWDRGGISAPPPPRDGAGPPPHWAPPPPPLPT